MLFRSLIILLFLLQLSSVGWSQEPRSKYNWRFIGHESTPASTADSGKMTCTGMGWVESLLITEKYLFAGSITGGLYRSKNDGKSWKKVDSDSVQMGSLDLTAYNGVIYRATGLTHFDEKFGLGLLKSSDNGKTWEATGLAFKPQEKKPLWVIEVDKENGTFISCTHETIYRSEDECKQWSEVLNVPEANFRSVVFADGSNVAFASGSFLFQSQDDGKTWQNITSRLYGMKEKAKADNQLRIAIAADPNTPGRFVAAYTSKSEYFIDQSFDYGETWTNIQRTFSIRRLDIHHNEIAIPLGSPEIMVIGGVRLFMSADSGRTFNQVTRPNYRYPNFVHDDIRALHVVDASTMYVGSDGGVSVTTDSAKTWQNASGKGLEITQIYGLGFKNNSIYYGCQDLGTFVKCNEIRSIGTLYGDGGDVHVLNDSQVLILANGRINRLDKEYKPRYIHPSTKQTPFVSKIHSNPSDSNSFFFVVDDLWKYQDGKWENRTRTLTKESYKATGFNVNVSDPNRMYFAYDQPTWNPEALEGKFFRTMDGGDNWDDITGNLGILAWRFISSITTNPANPDEVYVSLGIMEDGSAIHKVYKSVDGGNTWQNFSTGLPIFETYKIEFIPGSTSGVLVSTTKGMYYRNAGMNHWQKLRGRIPNIAVRDFELDLENKQIIAGTYGNGLWRMKLTKKMRRY